MKNNLKNKIKNTKLGKKFVLTRTQIQFKDRWSKAYQTNTLPYIETHLVDHCDLNCKGCGHFSPIASEYFANIKQFEEDCRQLSKLFSGAAVKVFRLMGGEPLLHKELLDFLRVARKELPQTDIRIVTNGIKLQQKEKEFWKTMADLHIGVDISNYPIKIDKEKIAADASMYHVDLNLSNEKMQFYKFVSSEKGDKDPSKAFKICKMVSDCPFLREGKLYLCGKPVFNEWVNEYFNLNLPIDCGFIDLYQENLTGREVLEFLSAPHEICRYCSEEYPKRIDWDISKKKKEEWF